MPATSSWAGCECCGGASTVATRYAISSMSSSIGSRRGARWPAHEGTSVNDLTFTILDVAAEQFSVTPRLIARIGITNGDDEPIQAIALRCQIRIEPLRRSYSDAEAEGL